jgi:DNA-binding response OmpR family regulator
VSGPPKRRILVVEDHEGSRAAIRRILAQIGYEVITAETVSAGLFALESLPSIILLDLRLPDGRGEAILEKVRADSLPCRVIRKSTSRKTSASGRRCSRRVGLAGPRWLPRVATTWTA